MYQTVPLTRENLREIYKKLTKKQLVEMLAESTLALNSMMPCPCDLMGQPIWDMHVTTSTVADEAS